MGSLKRNQSVPDAAVIPVLIYPDVRAAVNNAEDPFGHQWTFSETLADVDPAEWMRP